MTGPSFPLRGDLRDFAVNRILQAILAEDLEGCLTVSREGISRRLYLKGGMIIYATSTEPIDRLGEIFVAQGILTRDEVDHALSQSGPARRIGRILLVEGKITPQDLFQGVSAQVITILERMRSWRKGEYRFEFKREPKPGTVLLRVPLALYLGTPGRGRHEAVPVMSEEPEAQGHISVSGDESREAAAVEDSSETEKETAHADFTAEDELELTPGEVPARGADEEEVDISFDDEEDLRGTPAYGEIDHGGGAAEDRETAESKVLEEISFQVQELRSRLGGGPHRLLGVREDAGSDEVRESYEYFSRLFDPEELPEELPEDMAAAARDLHGRITAAFEDMRSGKKPMPMERVAPPPGRILSARNMGPAEPPTPENRPRRAYFKARKLMEKGNYWQAADALREAVRQQPEEAEYRHLLGICLVQTGRRLHEAEDHIKEAIRLEPGNPDYVTSLGQAYKAGRFFKKARRMFEQALFYDKGHAQARKELRNLPLETERSDKSKGIFSKFFGK